MSSSVLRGLQLLKSRVSHRNLVTKKYSARKNSNFKTWATRKYSSTTAVSSAESATSNRSSWLPFASVPVAFAAFWASNQDTNTLEKVNEDIEKMALDLKEPNADTLQLAATVISKIVNLPDKEIRRDTMYLLAALSSAAKVIAQVNPDSVEASKAVERSYAFAKRVASDSRQSEQLKLDALRCAHKAEYFVYVYRHDIENMKTVLEKDLKAIRAYNKAKKTIEMTFEESQALWMLAAALGNLDDPTTKDRLEESLAIFKGVTTENLTPELDKVWIERIVSSLSHSYTLEIGSHPKTSEEFRRIALALYEQYQRVAPFGTNIPKWKDLEIRLKSSVLATGPQ